MFGRFELEIYSFVYVSPVNERGRVNITIISALAKVVLSSGTELIV